MALKVHATFRAFYVEAHDEYWNSKRKQTF